MRTYLVAQTVKNMPTRDLGSIPGLGRSPEEIHGQRSLVGYSPWGHKVSDETTDFHSLTHSLTHLPNFSFCFDMTS